MSSAEDRARGDLAERVLPVAAQLACLVHDAGGRRDIHQVLARLADGEKDALITVLAGLVPTDTPLGSLLGYLTWDETGKRTDPTKTAITLRSLAEHYRPTQQAPYIDEIAVGHALSGRKVPLTRAERRAVIVRGLVAGMETETVAELLDMNYEAVKRSWERARAHARAVGEPVPTRPAWAEHPDTSAKRRAA
jgi:hypothetical protein